MSSTRTVLLIRIKALEAEVARLDAKITILELVLERLGDPSAGEEGEE